MKPQSRSSHGLLLSGRQWLGLLAASALFGTAAPRLWDHFEALPDGPDERIAFDVSGDYRLYGRLAARAVARGRVLVIGDSMVWGQYVPRERTLCHFLNVQAGEARFENLGLDGLHPAAMEGLLRYHARGVAGARVLLHCNPLWLSSPKQDLTAAEPVHFNHPELVPQFFPRVPEYREDSSRRIGIAVGRRLAVDGWSRHLQQAYFGMTDIPSWTIEHPYENPLGVMSGAFSPERALRAEGRVEGLRHRPIPWTEAGSTAQDFPWVRLDASFQWRSFQRVVGLLKERGNHVFVLLGPFNEHMILPSSRPAYARNLAGIKAWLTSNGIPFSAPPHLPTAEYADASHPLAPGYARLAGELRRDVDALFARK